MRVIVTIGFIARTSLVLLVLGLLAGAFFTS